MSTRNLISRNLILSLLFVSSCTSKTVRQNPGQYPHISDKSDISLNGIYAGLEEMCSTDSKGRKDCYLDPSEPNRKWYHLGYLRIENDNVFLDQSPINIGSKNDTLWSVSDGAFYYYSGTLQKKDSTIEFRFNELYCDYCGVPVKINSDGTKEVIKRTKFLKGYKTDKGILINGYLYERVLQNENLPDK